METPSVNYFSFEFDSVDLHHNWRFATSNKHDFTARRLENAAWRRFFQQKFQLPRISCKEIDYTNRSWLYGPVSCHKLDVIDNDYTRPKPRLSRTLRSSKLALMAL